MFLNIQTKHFLVNKRKSGLLIQIKLEYFEYILCNYYLINFNKWKNYVAYISVYDSITNCNSGNYDHCQVHAK